MRIFKNSWFARFARKQGIADEVLGEAVWRAENGLIDADMGGNVIKQRVARKGQGKSGGFHSIILYRTAQRAFFVYGFAKSERDNIDGGEMNTFRKSATQVLNLSDKQLAELIDKGILTEIHDHGKKTPQ